MHPPRGKAPPFPRTPYPPGPCGPWTHFRWFCLTPDRAGEHRSPADCRCHRRGHGIFLFGSPASPPVPRD
ncbi:hypothetical protein RADP37_03986a [Roseomonas mucosa]|uniref:Uncharacterized protein n=1 Tax=Roseomonas mucosa TaxID=207340 RepID=A0A4Y1MT84_9PROT|nr:hypothetical protein RADP37_03986a [Roseomonas mucosa]